MDLIDIRQNADSSAMGGDADSPRGHLGSCHFLAKQASALCLRAHGLRAARNGLGNVACGLCWERAVRDDERTAMEPLGAPVPDEKDGRAHWTPYFGHRHPLAGVAQSHCLREHGVHVARNGYGHVACGKCWERAVRDDERIVVEHDLPRQLTSDPDYIDEIAVELAIRGEAVRLTSSERKEAIRRLRAAGVDAKSVGRRLRSTRSVLPAVVAPMDVATDLGQEVA